MSETTAVLMCVNLHRWMRDKTGLRGTSCELRVTSYEVRVASYEVRVASYEVRVAGCELRVADLSICDSGFRI